MKDKRNLLKLAVITQLVYSVVSILWIVISKKIGDKEISEIFIHLVSLIFVYVLYKLSKKEIDVIKGKKIPLIVSGIWLLLDSIIPGVLCFIFLYTISNKNKIIAFPEPNKINDKYKCIKAISYILIFIFIMYVLPLFNIRNNCMQYFVYIFLFLITVLFNYKYMKQDFINFRNNFKVYFPFIIRRYFIMLGLMLVVSIPIVLINNGNTSTNQQMLNEMFIKMPLVTFLLSSLYAPIVEENIFRLSLSKLINNKYLFILISGFSFGILHVIDKFTSATDLLYIFVYSTLGICLAKSYYDSKNIFVSISMHFIQNFIAGILVLLLYVR